MTTELAVLGPVGCGAAAVLCLHEVGRRRLHHAAVDLGAPWRPWLFRAGVVLAVLVVLPPIGRWAPRELFARSMVDVTLAYMVAPLVMLAEPKRALTAALRRSLGSADRGDLGGEASPVSSFPASGWAAPPRPMVRPVAGVVAFLAVVGVWHVPAVLDGSAGSTLVWDLEMVSWLAAGLFLWSQLFGSDRTRPALEPLDRIWLAMAVLAVVSLLGASMLFSPETWYPAFDGGRGALLRGALDQAFAGAILGVVPALPLGGFAWWGFTEWIRRDADDDLHVAQLATAMGDTRGAAVAAPLDRLSTEERSR